MSKSTVEVTDRLVVPMRPDFIIIGAQKSGTTSLARALRRHPDVFIPARKESHHFDMAGDSDLLGPSYRDFFSEWSGERLIGEGTPEYMSGRRSMTRIVENLPDIKILAVLRNPIDRAHSAYWHGQRVGVTRHSFEGALADESRLGIEEPGFWDLTERGKYINHLQRWIRSGLDRDRLHVMLYDDLLDDRSTAVDDVQRFLGIEPQPLVVPHSNSAKRSRLPVPLRRIVFAQRGRPAVRDLMNRTLVPFTPPPMDPATRRMLVERFRPYNRALEVFLDRDLSQWDQ